MKTRTRILEELRKGEALSAWHLANLLNLHVSTINDHLARMHELGLIHVHRREHLRYDCGRLTPFWLPGP